jgi:hypothetical protein
MFDVIKGISLVCKELLEASKESSHSKNGQALSQKLIETDQFKERKKQEQIILLMQGRSYWNEWREQNPDAVIDLSDARLRYMNLKEMNLSRVNLSNVRFKGADLSGANLSGANLSNVYLGGADFSGANLSGANLDGTEDSVEVFPILLPDCVFISYSNKDKELVEKICTNLRKAGIEPWVDKNLMPGTSIWELTIRKVIARSYALILIVSPHSEVGLGSLQKSITSS